MTEELRVLIADDQPLMSGALRTLVDSAPGFTCVGVAADGAQAVEGCSADPHVVLMDMQMPVMDGVEATRRISREHPEIRVLAITTFTSQDYVIPALRAGAAGYLVKDSEPETILEAIRTVSRGESVLSPAVTQNLLTVIAAEQEGPQPTPVDPGAPDGTDLTARELDVLRLLGRGRSNPEISQALLISESTVKASMSRVMEKLEVRDRVQALIKAAQLGLITLSLD